MCNLRSRAGSSPWWASYFLILLVTLLFALPGALAQSVEGVPRLIAALKGVDVEGRRKAAEALGLLGWAAKDAVPALVAALKDDDTRVRAAAARAIGRIGPAAKDAVPALVAALKEDDAGVRSAAAESLGWIGPAAKDAVPVLAAALKDGNGRVRVMAADALRELGSPAEDAVPVLAAALKDSDYAVRQAATETLGRIATSLSKRRVVDATVRRHLQEALAVLQASDNHWPIDDAVRKDATERLEATIVLLKALEDSTLDARLSRWFATLLLGDWRLWAVVLYAGWLVLLLAVFLAKPLWLLRWSDALKDQLSIKIKPGNHELSVGVPIGYVSLIRLVAYRRWVLDAWVKAHVGKCREIFKELPSVKAREVHVPSPLKVDGQLVTEFSATTLRPHVGRAGHQCRWLVLGEGGAGKTSLACQMARWAMAEDKAQRLAPHRMLPVLIEDELDNPATQAGLARFTEAIRGKLQALIGSVEPVPPELLKHLLRQWRVLVVIDHLTEMSEATRAQIRFDAPEFPATALVVTARAEAALRNLPNRHTLEPMRIEGNRLSTFIDAYLSVRGKRHLFDDEDFFEACRRLTQMVGERDVTVLLAKLYADQMIALREENPQGMGTEPPETIHELMLWYLNELNRNAVAGEPDNATLHRDAKAIAWECLKQTYQPAPADRGAVIEAMNEEGDSGAKERLVYYRDMLRLVQVTGVGGDRVRFALDPLAEYLAGMKVVEKNKGTKRDWERFIERADAMPGAPETVKGFLLAVRDCCLEMEDARVPDFVPEELGKRGGLDPEHVYRVRRKRRIQRLIEDLKSSFVEDRRHAAEALAGIGPEAKKAVPDLVAALKDGEVRVRAGAADALGGIGPAAVDAIPDLVAALKDGDNAVRAAAARALGRLGPAAVAAIPDLIDALKDSHYDVRAVAADALGGLGPAAVPDLIAALEDGHYEVRMWAAQTLGGIGPAAVAAVPDLIDALKDGNGTVRLWAAQALGQIGPAARDALPTLQALSKGRSAGSRI
jgi:HEAT repeat protein